VATTFRHEALLYDVDGHQLCDLVQLRGFPEGAAVRVHLYLP
jgi:hypothetical protein